MFLWRRIHVYTDVSQIPAESLCDYVPLFDHTLSGAMHESSFGSSAHRNRSADR